jgi:hypothetical protein
MNANGGSSATGTIDVNGRIRCEGEVVHIVANHRTDLSADLAGVSDRDDGSPLPHGRGDEFHHGNPGIDAPNLPPKVPKPGTIHPGPRSLAVSASGFDHAARRSVIRVSSDGRPRRSAKPGHSPVPLFT